MYKVNHPADLVYFNTESLFSIIKKASLGELSRLSPDERDLRPDITDIDSACLFEIKPRTEQGLQECRRDVQLYLAAMNRATAPGLVFSGGTDFQGETLIRFAGGQYIWRLEWHTAEPGVVLYRWTRSQQRFASEAAAYEAGQWVDLTEEELRQFGGWVGQAVDAMVERRERLATLQGSVGVAIELIGTAATTFFSGVILQQLGSGPGAQQPPIQGSGRVLPFPARPPPSAVSAPGSAAAARGLGP